MNGCRAFNGISASFPRCDLQPRCVLLRLIYILASGSDPMADIQKLAEMTLGSSWIKSGLCKQNADKNRHAKMCIDMHSFWNLSRDLSSIVIIYSEVATWPCILRLDMLAKINPISLGQGQGPKARRVSGLVKFWPTCPSNLHNWFQEFQGPVRLKIIRISYGYHKDIIRYYLGHLGSWVRSSGRHIIGGF